MKDTNLVNGLDGKKILDVTCGSRIIWFDKQHPAAVYCDIRDEECTAIWKSTNRDSERTCIIHPDVQCDFTDLPFPDNSFALVVFDPPHLQRVGENAWMRKKYGKLGEGWPDMLRDGFRECMRVLKPDGVLIFKWAETQIPAADVWKAIGEKPLFGHHSGKKSQTFWGCFMKLVGELMNDQDFVSAITGNTGNSGWRNMVPQVDSSDFPTQWVPSAYECSIIDAQAKEIENLRGQNRQLMLERNYVMSIIADVRKAGKTWMCQYCAHCKGIVSGMADCDSKKLCVMPYSQFELKRPEPLEVGKC